VAWAVILLSIFLGSFSALRPSGRRHDFRRSKEED
jgi:hypothetical protein